MPCCTTIQTEDWSRYNTGSDIMLRQVWLLIHCGTAVIYLIKGCILGTQVTGVDFRSSCKYRLKLLRLGYDMAW